MISFADADSFVTKLKQKRADKITDLQPIKYRY